MIRKPMLLIFKYFIVLQSFYQMLILIISENRGCLCGTALRSFGSGCMLISEGITEYSGLVIIVLECNL